MHNISSMDTDISFWLWTYCPDIYVTPFNVCLSVCHTNKLYAQFLLHFKREILKALHASLLPYGESHIVRTFWSNHFWSSYFSFHHKMFHQNGIWFSVKNIFNIEEESLFFFSFFFVRMFRHRQNNTTSCTNIYYNFISNKWFISNK